MAEEKSEKKLFRFQDLEIWKKAIEIGNKLFDIADRLEEMKLYRFAEQVRPPVCPCQIIYLREAGRFRVGSSVSFSI
jgi:hypothetical protein